MNNSSLSYFERKIKTTP